MALFAEISQSFQQKGSALCSPDLKHLSFCSLGSGNSPWGTKASPTLEHWWHLPFSHTSFPHHILFPPTPLLWISSQHRISGSALSTWTGVWKQREHDLTRVWEEERKRMHNTQAWGTQILCFKPDQGECQANPEDKGEKSHCKKGPTFSPHVL